MGRIFIDRHITTSNSRNRFASSNHWFEKVVLLHRTISYNSINNVSKIPTHATKFSLSYTIKCMQYIGKGRKKKGTTDSETVITISCICLYVTFCPRLQMNLSSSPFFSQRGMHLFFPSISVSNRTSHISSLVPFNVLS